MNKGKQTTFDYETYHIPEICIYNYIIYCILGEGSISASCTRFVYYNYLYLDFLDDVTLYKSMVGSYMISSRAHNLSNLDLKVFNVGEFTISVGRLFF